MNFYSKQHYARVSPRADRPEEIAERIRYRKVAEQVMAELHERFPVITSENFAEADRFRERRTQELLRVS